MNQTTCEGKIIALEVSKTRDRDKTVPSKPAPERDLVALAAAETHNAAALRREPAR